MQVVFRKLIVENFKSFNGKHVFLLDRGPGLFYVTGENLVNPELGANGVGKTALIGDALTWVLWNKTGKDLRPAEAIVPWKGDHETRVVLFYRKDEIKHKLERSRHPNRLILDGKDIQQTDVEKSLGMTEAMFRSAVVLAQFGELFLDLKAEQQSQMFNAALGLDVWLQASDRARRSVREGEKELNELKMATARLEGSLVATEEALARAKEDAKRWEANKLERIEVVQNRIKKEATAVLAKVPSLNLKPKYTDLTPSRLEGYLPALKNGCMELRNGLRGELNTALTLAAEITAETRTLQKSCNSYEVAIRGAKTCPECGQKVSTSHLKQKLQEVRTRLEKLPKEPDVQSIRTALTEVEAQERTIEKLEDLYADLEQISKESPPSRPAEELLKAKKKAQQELQESTDVLQHLEKTMEINTYWIDAFKTIRLNLIDQVLVELSIASTRHAEALGLDDWRIEFRTEKETKGGNVSVLFQALLYPPDVDEPVKWESYSGGESQRWQLAVAFGLSEIVLERCGVMPDLEVLDEPTRGLSPEGVGALLEHLSERAADLKRSIYIVDHHSLSSGMFNETILIQKDKTGSHVKGSEK